MRIRCFVTGFWSLAWIMLLATVLAAGALPSRPVMGAVSEAEAAVPTVGWVQANDDGFGDLNNYEVTRLSFHEGYLYASTANDDTGGEMWRTGNGTTWHQINDDGFGSAANNWALVEQSHEGHLYVGTLNAAAGAEIWRCAACDGTDWQQVVGGGFGDGNNAQLERVVAFADDLYATTNNAVTGAEVWRSTTGDSGSWTQCNVDGFGDPRNTELWTVAIFDGHLYAATAQWEAWGSGTHTGVEVWRTDDGTTWNQVNTDGFGDRENFAYGMAPFRSYLYLSTTNVNTGTQLWRCAACDGSDWAPVVGGDFGDSNNFGAFLLDFDQHFYACTQNDMTGTQVWRTADGTEWHQTNVDGFGDADNEKVWSGAVLGNRLFLGTHNRTNGGEVWMKLHQVYLPLTLHNER